MSLPGDSFVAIAPGGRSSTSPGAQDKVRSEARADPWEGGRTAFLLLIGQLKGYLRVHIKRKNFPCKHLELDKGRLHEATQKQQL